MDDEPVGGLAAHVHPKVSAATAGSAAALVIVWAARQLGVDVPHEVAAALVVVVTFAAGWLRSSGAWTPGA